MLTPSSIPDTEPELVYAGQTIKWTKSLSDYPSDEYTLKYYLAGPASLTLTGSQYESTTAHLISVTAAVSAAYTYGIYQWQSYAEKGAGETLKKYFIASGFITIKTAAGKSFAKTMLDAIESILTNSATSKDLDLVSKNLGGTSITRDRDKLMQYRDKFRNEYNAELSNENRIAGKGTGSKIRVRFRSA